MRACMSNPQLNYGEHMKLEAATRLKAHRSQDWYSKLTAEEKEVYRQKFPGTRFHDKTRILHPDTLTAALIEAGFVSRINALPNLGGKAKQALVQEFKEQVHHVSSNLGITKSAVITAFKEPKMSNLLEATGYSFATLWGAVHMAHKVAEQGALHVIAQLAEHHALHKVAHKGAHKAKKVDELVEKYPVLKKLTGPALAGMLIYGYTLTEPHKLGDWDLGNVKKALAGEFGIHDFLQTSEALYLGVHVATGKALSLSAIAQSASTLALGLACTTIINSDNPRLQKLAGHVKGVASKFKPQKSVLIDLAESKGFGGKDVLKTLEKDKPATQDKPQDKPKGESKYAAPDWWTAMSEEAQSQYLKLHPHSGYQKGA